MEDRYESLRLRNQLCFPMVLCAREITRRYQPMLDKLNLTYTQYVVMMVLWERSACGAKDLSRALLMDPSTLTPILKKLEQKGFLTRSRDPRDERSLVVALTAEGLALRDEAVGIPARMANCLGLSDEEAFALGSIIGKVLTNIEKEL